MALTFLFSEQALAADIDAKLPDNDNTSSFQVKNSSDSVLMKVKSGGDVSIETNGKLVFPPSHYGVKIELYKEGEERIGTADNQLQLISGNLTGANIAFFGAPAGSSSLTEVMRVGTDSAGKVGIGTTDPKEKFQIGDRFTFNGQNDGSSSWRVISDNAYYDVNSEHDKRIVADYSAAMAFTDDGDILFRTAPTGSAGGILDSSDPNYPTWSSSTPPLIVKNDGKIGIGISPPNSTLHVNGSFSMKYTHITSTYTTSGDTIIGVDPSEGSVTVTLATADRVPGRIIIIKDESGNAGTSNTITIQGNDVDIDNGDYVIAAPYGFLKVYSDGSQWFIIGK